LSCSLAAGHVVARNCTERAACGGASSSHTLRCAEALTRRRHAIARSARSAADLRRRCCSGANRALRFAGRLLHRCKRVRRVVETALAPVQEGPQRCGDGSCTGARGSAELWNGSYTGARGSAALWKRLLHRCKRVRRVVETALAPVQEGSQSCGNSSCTGARGSPTFGGGCCTAARALPGRAGLDLHACNSIPTTPRASLHLSRARDQG
jgi:hypothetical protein